MRLPCIHCLARSMVAWLFDALTRLMSCAHEPRRVDTTIDVDNELRLTQVEARTLRLEALAVLLLPSVRAGNVTGDIVAVGMIRSGDRS